MREFYSTSETQWGFEPWALHSAVEALLSHHAINIIFKFLKYNLSSLITRKCKPQENHQNILHRNIDSSDLQMTVQQITSTMSVERQMCMCKPEAENQGTLSIS